MVALLVLPEISPPASAGCPVCLCPERGSSAFSREDHSVISRSAGEVPVLSRQGEKDEPGKDGACDRKAKSMPRRYG